MRLYEIPNEEYESKDDLTVALAEAITEVQDLEKSCNDYRDEVARLEDEIVALKEKNLQMLSMVATKVNEEPTETETTEKLEISDVFKEI